MRAVLAATLFAATALVGCATGSPVVDNQAGAAVRIENGGGVGSGVYIGNGVIITAAHVVDGTKQVKIKSDHGDIQSADVLWANKEYDIAALRPNNARRFKAAQLSCRTPSVGEEISAWGNPAGVEFVTMHGYVSGDERPAGDKWKSVFLTDMTTIGGMSGGPTYDSSRRVVGITVGTLGFGAPAGGLGFAVPGSVVCGLLGRV